MSAFRASMAPHFSRRRALAMLGGSAGAVLLGSCASSPTLGPASQDLAFVDGDHSGARLSAILRKSFIDVSNELVVDQSMDWSTQMNATLEPRLLDDWREAYADVAARREGDDLAEMFGSAPHLYAHQLADVSHLAEELGSAHGGWMTGAAEGAIVDGVWRAIPWLYTAQAVNFREDVLDAAGVGAPNTYEELLEVATALHDQGLPLAGFSMGTEAPNDSGSLAYSMLWSFGAHEVAADGQTVALDSQQTRDALAFFAELSAVSSPTVFDFGEGTNNSAFLGSEIAMTQNASSIYWKALQDHPDVADAMNHVKYPSGPAGYHQLVELNYIAVFRHSRNYAAAVDWIRFMMQPSQLRPRSEAALSFFTPSLLDYVDDPDMPWNTDAKLAGMKGINDGGHLPGWPGPPSVEASLVYENASLVRMFQAVGQNTMSIDDAVAVATQELKRVYET